MGFYQFCRAVARASARLLRTGRFAMTVWTRPPTTLPTPPAVVPPGPGTNQPAMMRSCRGLQNRDSQPGCREPGSQQPVGSQAHNRLCWEPVLTPRLPTQAPPGPVLGGLCSIANHLRPLPSAPISPNWWTTGRWGTTSCRRAASCTGSQGSRRNCTPSTKDGAKVPP